MPGPQTSRCALVLGALSCVLLVTSGASASIKHRADSDSGLAALSWGFRTGLNFAQHVGTEERGIEYDVDSEWRTGITAALFVYLPVTSRFGLQQELVYTQKGSSQRIGVEIIEIPTTLDVAYEMDYLEIPVLARYAWVKDNGREFYSLAGMAMSLKIHDHYELSGEVSDGIDTIEVTASSDMSEVELFDFSVVYGLGYEFETVGHRLLIEYRFTMSWNTLAMPTYAYVPFGEEEVLIDNEPVPLKNQTHCLTIGVRF